MKFVNLLEDKVLELTDAYLKEKDIEVDSKLKMDLAVYTLNRLPPKYVVSGRGMLHTIQEHELPQSSADILNIINEAYKTISSRRVEELPNELISKIPETGNYFIYPEIIGLVYDANNFIRLEHGKVAAYEEGDLLPSFNSDFPNPYDISEKTPGRFVFRFFPKKVDAAQEKDVTIEIVVESASTERHIAHAKILLKTQALKKGEMPTFPTYTMDAIYIPS